MWISVTQRLPDAKTLTIRVNTDLIERVSPWDSGTAIVFQSGQRIEVDEDMHEMGLWLVASEGGK